MRRNAGRDRHLRGALPLHHHADATLDRSLALRRVRAHNFRNLSAFDWRPAGRAEVLLGPNGSGKTSALEVVYLSATAKSFRTNRLVECCASQEGGFDLRCEIASHARIELRLSFDGEARERKASGKTLPYADHVALLPLLLWTRDESELLSGPPRLRRRFFDRVVVARHPVVLSDFAALRRALEAKRALLRRGDLRSLSAWNEALAPIAWRISRARAEAIAAIDGAVGVLAEDSGFGGGAPTVVYRPSVDDALESEDSWIRAFESHRDEEIRRATPLIGPQRDEITIHWRDGAPAALASAGERKLIGLHLLAAAASFLSRLDREPVVLVDDVDSELDRERFDVARRLFASFSQVVFTSNRNEIWDADRAIFRRLLRDGRMSE